MSEHMYNYRHSQISLPFVIIHNFSCKLDLNIQLLQQFLQSFFCLPAPVELKVLNSHPNNYIIASDRLLLSAELNDSLLSFIHACKLYVQ